ncbi:hypothetical protein [Actinokineospora bangkokensis]|uniref:hypothetical protein n=1 Tax=Actinokineospora bangkokensis TaxID=1193682 RepID=UPI000AE13F62|nr:hypothetical protein [Actinokineospora bangkokensis]
MSNLDGSEIDFITLFYGFLKDVKKTPLVTSGSNLYLTIENLKASGRTIYFSADQGRFGTEGKLVDIKSGSTTKEISESESAVTTTKNLLVASENGPYALLIGERYGSHSSAGTVLSTFYRAFVEKFRDSGKNFVFKNEGYIDKEAWSSYLKNADMKSVQVNKYEASSDIADGTIRSSIGKIVCQMRPRRGLGHFGRNLRDQLITGDVNAHSIIGIKEDPGDEVEVVLSDGIQQRRLLLGAKNVPVLLHSLAADDADRLSSDDVLDAMLTKVSDLRSKVGLKLPDDWKKKAWTRQQLNVKMAAYRDK